MIMVDFTPKELGEVFNEANKFLGDALDRAEEVIEKFVYAHVLERV